MRINISQSINFKFPVFETRSQNMSKYWGSGVPKHVKILGVWNAKWYGARAQHKIPKCCIGT